jgi:hypothetical protein
MKIDMIYKIYRMRMKRINPVNLVNHVYFQRRIHNNEEAIDVDVSSDGFIDDRSSRGSCS